MPYKVTADELSQSRQMVETFCGYDHNLRIADGYFYDTEGLTTDFYPVMSQRQKRSTYVSLTSGQGILAKDALAYVDNCTLYYNGLAVSMTGVSITTGEKTLVSMGAYLCIFPDGIYYNTEDSDDYGYMAQTNAIACSTTNVTYSICKLDGTAITIAYTQATAPDDPTNGQYWLDTSGDTHVLKLWSSSSSMWSEVSTVYVKIAANGIGTLLKDYDGVTISGCTAPTGSTAKVTEQIEALNGTVVAYDAEANYIIVVGLLDTSVTQTTGTVTVARKVPSLDFVTECNNRLWGCKYGVVDGETVNEIYCCALGDFKNWNRFLGVSTDSYVATVGSDGQFTGAITHLGYPLFFKENCIHKVYPSTSGAHQIVAINCRGVQKGSDRSLAIVNETLFYKSRVDICSFDGSLPTTVSSALGTVHYRNAHAGVCGDKYCVSMQSAEDNTWHFFVLDVLKGFWMREDSLQIIQFADKDNDLYMLTSDNKIICEKGTGGTTDTADVSWYAETGVIGFSYPDNKYLSRFNLRMSLNKGSKFDVYLQYDSDGTWHHMGHIEGQSLRTFTLPIRPRRCDHLKMKLSGSGEFKLYSLAYVLEIGSDY